MSGAGRVQSCSLLQFGGAERPCSPRRGGGLGWGKRSDAGGSLSCCLIKAICTSVGTGGRRGPFSGVPPAGPGGGAQWQSSLLRCWQKRCGAGGRGGRISATCPGQGAEDPACQEQCALKHRVASQSKELDPQSSFPSPQGPDPGAQDKASDPGECFFSLASSLCRCPPPPVQGSLLPRSPSLNRKAPRESLLRPNRSALPAPCTGRVPASATLLVARCEVCPSPSHTQAA